MAASTNDPSAASGSSEPVDVSLTAHSLARAVHARRPEYVRPHRVRVKIGSWNVAACPGTDQDLASWFVGGRGIDRDLATLDLDHNPAVDRSRAGRSDQDSDSVRLVGGEDIGLYVLGLQEIVDLNLTKEYVNRAVYSDHGPMEKWKAALEAAMPSRYELVMAEQMTGLLLLIYASPEVAPTITNISTRQVGTGIWGPWGYFGNKGAVTSRIVLGETTRMVFTNCHLASGADSSFLNRRCWDVGHILAKTQFDPVVHAGVAEDDGEKIGDEDFAFWFGDLNFRLDGLPGQDIRRILTLHTRGEYDISGNRPSKPPDGEGVIVMHDSESDDDLSNMIPGHSAGAHGFDSESSLPDPDDFPEDPSQDPTSLQATLDSLLTHDQLRRMIRQRKVFHDGWREGPITFLPSYKYDVGTVSLFDTSEKQRSPSWCDRILYRTRRDKMEYDRNVREEKESRKRDDEMKSRGMEQDDDVLFSYDPDTDGDGDEQPQGVAGVDYDEYVETEDQEPEDVLTKDGFLDRINLDIYTSHQRISSSDHKPLISIFTLDYDAVVPELKSKVHSEVARELDRAENEGRPGITIVVEGDDGQDETVVDFGEVLFLDRKSCSLTIANTGSVAAAFSFVVKPGVSEEEQPPYEWLSTTFVLPDGDSTQSMGKSVTLEPGETILALVVANVSSITQLQALNQGRTTLDEVLVLRVEDGRDHFIPVKGSWVPSCFGRSVDELVRIPDGGIREFVKSKNIRGAIPYDMDVHCSAPRELFKLTEAIQTLAERCVADEAMLEEMALPKEPGWPFDPATWGITRNELDVFKVAAMGALDTDSSLLEALPPELPSSHRLEVFASVLLLFLASLTDGIVSSQLWAKLSTGIPNLVSVPTQSWPTIKTQVLDILSSAPNNNIAFVFLTTTLARVAAELSPSAASDNHRLSKLGRRLSFRRGVGEDETSRKRRARERKFAEIVGPVACRPPSDGEKGVRERERTLMEMFLQRDDTV